jgi:hypothetical protein
MVSREMSFSAIGADIKMEQLHLASSINTKNNQNTTPEGNPAFPSGFFVAGFAGDSF